MTLKSRCWERPLKRPAKDWLVRLPDSSASSTALRLLSYSSTQLSERTESESLFERAIPSARLRTYPPECSQSGVRSPSRQPNVLKGTSGLSRAWLSRPLPPVSNEARANSRRTSSSGSKPKGCLLVEKTLRLMQSRSGPPVQLCCPAYFLFQLCTARMLQMHRSCGVHHDRSKPQGGWGGLQVELPCFACTWLLSLSSMRPFRSRLEVPTILMM